MVKEKSEKEELFSTNIRMPKHLAHKLGILAESDDRSLNSYMAKALEEYVSDFESDMALAFEDRFIEAHKSIFGADAPPYITLSITENEFGKAKSILKNIPRATQKSTRANTEAPRSTGRLIGRQATAEEKEQKIFDDMNIQSED